MYTNYYKAERKDGRSNFIKVELFYKLGGRCWFNGKNEPRGYRLTVSPIIKNGRIESCVVSEGKVVFVKEVKRQSAKAEKEAEHIAMSLESRLVNEVCEKYGMKLV